MAYNQETADKVLQGLSEGKSLRKACAGLVDPSYLLRWTEENPEFGQQYTRVRARAYEMLADELVEISDDSTNDTIVTEDGKVVTNQEVVARSRLRVDTRKWMLAKMLPKVYGEKLELAGVVNVKTTPADLSDDDLAAIAAGRKLNSLALKVPENMGSDLPTIENCSNGDNNA